MASTNLPVSSLRAHLLSSLSTLPGSRIFHLHLLISSPRKPGQSLFPFAPTRPKCLVQDILVLLSEQTNAVEKPSAEIASASDDYSNLTPRTFVSAIEATVYGFPATDSTILYISKVDGTGQGVFPSPTSTLLRAFLAFYASPRSPLYTSPSTTHHLWIHLFARSQRQYLFPNSADHPDKKPLGDVALCKWWKKVLSGVAQDVETDYGFVPALDTLMYSTRLHYILPGQSELEASSLLREAKFSSTSPLSHWIYSHPYNIQTEIGVPFPSAPHGAPPSDSREQPPLASVIPHFEDDPKSRFIDELAATSEEHAVAVPVPTPKRKRPKIGEGDEDSNSTLTSGGDATPSGIGATASSNPYIHGPQATAEVGTPFAPPPVAPLIMYNPPSSSPPHAETHSPPIRPSTPEPTLPRLPTLLSPHTPNLPTSTRSLLSPDTPLPSSLAERTNPASPHTPQGFFRSPQTPRTPRRPKSDLDSVSSAEFWERMSFRQECALGAVTGFFVAVFSRRSCNQSTLEAVDDTLLSTRSNAQDTNPSAAIDVPFTFLSGGTIPHSVLKRVMSSLLTGVEFSTSDRSHKGTNVIESAIKGLCDGLGQEVLANGESETTKFGVDSTVPTARDLYAAHVYASSSISNPPLARKSADNVGAGMSVGTPVNMLGVRRKKRRE